MNNSNLYFPYSSFTKGHWPYINHGNTSYTRVDHTLSPTQELPPLSHPTPPPPPQQPPGAGETRQIKHHIIYDSTNLTYMIQCKRCKKKNIGETKRTLRERYKEHRQATNNPLHANATAAVSSHFSQPSHSIEDMELLPLELQPPSAHVTP